MKINGFKSRKELIENLYGASTLVDENARPYRSEEKFVDRKSVV